MDTIISKKESAWLHQDTSFLLCIIFAQPDQRPFGGENLLSKNDKINLQKAFKKDYEQYPANPFS